MSFRAELQSNTIFSAKADFSERYEILCRFWCLGGRWIESPDYAPHLGHCLLKAPVAVNAEGVNLEPVKQINLEAIHLICDAILTLF